MFRKVSFILFMLAVGLGGSFKGSTTPVYAQEVNERRPDAQKLRELKQKIGDLKQKKLVEALQLDDETSRKFFEHYRPAQKDIEGLVRERNETLKSLRDRLKSGASETDVEADLKRAQELTKRIQERVGTLDKDLKPVLSPRQRAKLMMFEHEFNKRVKERVQKMDRGGRQFREREELRERLKQFHNDHPNWRERMKNERERLRRFGKRP